jgi:hypothetical protein
MKELWKKEYKKFSVRGSDYELPRLGRGEALRSLNPYFL